MTEVLHANDQLGLQQRKGRVFQVRAHCRPRKCTAAACWGCAGLSRSRQRCSQRPHQANAGLLDASRSDGCRGAAPQPPPTLGRRAWAATLMPCIIPALGKSQTSPCATDRGARQPSARRPTRPCGTGSPPSPPQPTSPNHHHPTGLPRGAARLPAHVQVQARHRHLLRAARALLDRQGPLQAAPKAPATGALPAAPCTTCTTRTPPSALGMAGSQGRVAAG
jgi:hypothetical protein